MTAILLALWQVVKPHVLMIGVCCAVWIGGFALGYHIARPVAPISVQTAQHDTQQAAAVAAKAETVFVHDTLRYAVWRTRYDTVRATLNIHDTVQVMQYVRVTDSTIESCNAAIASCARAGAAKDSVIAAKDREIAAIQASRQSLGHHLLVDGGLALVGALADHYLIPPRHSTTAAFTIHLPTPLRLFP